jgi:hypothetical protein
MTIEHYRSVYKTSYETCCYLLIPLVDQVRKSAALFFYMLYKSAVFTLVAFELKR